MGSQYTTDAASIPPDCPGLSPSGSASSVESRAASWSESSSQIQADDCSIASSADADDCYASAAGERLADDLAGPALVIDNACVASRTRAQVRRLPRRCADTARKPPSLLRQSERRSNFVDGLVGRFPRLAVSVLRRVRIFGPHSRGSLAALLTTGGRGRPGYAAPARFHSGNASTVTHQLLDAPGSAILPLADQATSVEGTSADERR
jgi:hypothetical protein